MATLTAPFRIDPVSSWYFQQRYFYTWNTTSATPLYVHMKTNLTGAANNEMWMIEAIGYNYGTSLPIRCAWGFYLYNYGAPYTYGLLQGIGLKKIYNGLDPDGVYLSTDGYVCLRAYNASSLSYCGFTLCAYATRTDSTEQNISVTASVQSSTSGSYY